MLKTAIQAAKASGAILLKYFETEIDIRQKGEHDLVTNVDNEAENKVIAIIKKKFPDHSFDCEEAGVIGDRKSEYLWIIDALDGTINFTRDLAPFAVSIGLLHKGKPLLGVIYDPLHNELYSAEKGKGASVNGKKIAVSNRNELSHSLVVADLTTKRDFHSSFFTVLKSISKDVLGIRVTHCTSLNLAHLARGKFDIYLKNRIDYHDIVAGAIIVQEAGGIITDFHNNDINRKMSTVIATNGKLHTTALKKITY